MKVPYTMNVLIQIPFRARSSIIDRENGMMGSCGPRDRPGRCWLDPEGESRNVRAQVPCPFQCLGSVHF